MRPSSQAGASRRTRTRAPARRRTVARRRLALLLGVIAVVVLVLRGAAALVPDDGDGRARAAAPRPTPPPRVALQVGHWRHDELPDELRAVRKGAGGASWAGAVEWQVNLAIARAAQRRLVARGVAAELLPATVPPRYHARAFVSIHADGNGDLTVSGFKAAAFARDRTGRARALSASLVRRYSQRTGLAQNPVITADMTEYYAFDAGRFRNAVDPATPAVVLETGFLSNDRDRSVIVEMPDRAGAGIADGIVDFLRRPTRASP